MCISVYPHTRVSVLMYGLAEPAGFGSSGIRQAAAKFYHDNQGSIHCGTNAVREISTLYKWWEY